MYTINLKDADTVNALGSILWLYQKGAMLKAYDQHHITGIVEDLRGQVEVLYVKLADNALDRI
jgi:hypothetical protein